MQSAIAELLRSPYAPPAEFPPFLPVNPGMRTAFVKVRTAVLLNEVMNHIPRILRWRVVISGWKLFLDIDICVDLR